MEYIIIPKELFDSVPEEAKIELGIDKPRTSVDGTEVILHVEHYDTLFPPVSTLSDDEENTDTRIIRAYPTYVNPSTEFSAVIDSEKWSPKEESES